MVFDGLNRGGGCGYVGRKWAVDPFLVVRSVAVRADGVLAICCGVFVLSGKNATRSDDCAGLEHERALIKEPGSVG